MNCISCSKKHNYQKVAEKECELMEQINDEHKHLKELLLQDESEFDENDTWYRGKKVNIPLVEAHIKYYGNKLAKLKANGLTRWIN